MKDCSGAGEGTQHSCPERRGEGSPAFMMMLLTVPQLLLKVKILMSWLIILFFPGKTNQFNVTAFFPFLWPGDGVGRELSTAHSLKCKLIFYVIFQYIFYSLNLFENFCLCFLFFFSQKIFHLILRPLPSGIPRELNGQCHF